MERSNPSSSHQEEQDRDGASPNERLLFSAKQDLEELFLEVEEAGGYDINFKDGLGNTALHYAVINLSPNVLELILEHEGADVDLINKLGQTPLHCAVQIELSKPRLLITQSLLEAGADPRIRTTKTKEKPIDILMARLKGEARGDGGEGGKDNDELIKLLKQSEADMNLDEDDIVNDDDDGDVGSDDVASD